MEMLQSIKESGLHFTTTILRPYTLPFTPEGRRELADEVVYLGRAAGLSVIAGFVLHKIGLDPNLAYPLGAVLGTGMNNDIDAYLYDERKRWNNMTIDLNIQNQ